VAWRCCSIWDLVFLDDVGVELFNLAAFGRIQSGVFGQRLAGLFKGAGGGVQIFPGQRLLQPALIQGNRCFPFRCGDALAVVVAFAVADKCLDAGLRCLVRCWCRNGQMVKQCVQFVVWIRQKTRIGDDAARHPLAVFQCIAGILQP